MMLLYMVNWLQTELRRLDLYCTSSTNKRNLYGFSDFKYNNFNIALKNYFLLLLLFLCVCVCFNDLVEVIKLFLLFCIH